MCKNSLMKAAIKNKPDWSTLAEQGCTVSQQTAAPIAS
jgi:hypothetical protein